MYLEIILKLHESSVFLFSGYDSFIRMSKKQGEKKNIHKKIS